MGDCLRLERFGQRRSDSAPPVEGVDEVVESVSVTGLYPLEPAACVGALSAADDRGLTVPGGLSLIGYDDTYLAKIRHLSLTSVDNGNFAVGAQAAKFLLQRIEQPGLPQRRFLHPPTLSVRRSTAGPADDTD